MGYWSEEAREKMIDVKTGIGKAVEDESPPGTEHSGKLILPVSPDLGKSQPQEKSVKFPTP